MTSWPVCGGRGECTDWPRSLAASFARSAAVPRLSKGWKMVGLSPELLHFAQYKYRHVLFYRWNAMHTQHTVAQHAICYICMMYVFLCCILCVINNNNNNNRPSCGHLHHNGSYLVRNARQRTCCLLSTL